MRKYSQDWKRFWQAGTGLLGLVLIGLIPGSAQRQEPQLYGGGTFSPTQQVRVEYYLPGGGSSQVRVLRIGNPEKVVELGGPRGFERTGELRLSPVQSIPVFRTANRPYGEVSLGRLPEGLYLVQIGTPRPSSATLVLVTNLGLLVKSDPQRMLVYTASLSNGQPRTAQIFVSRDKRLVRQVRAEGGLAYFQSDLNSSENLFVAARSGASWAFSSAYWQSWNQEQNRVYLITDRPVYRPGHTVFFKGTARSASGLKPVAGQPVEVEVRDYDDNEVFSSRFTTDAYGSFSGQFRIGLDARLGGYTLVARLGDEEHTGEFEVQEFVKPEYRVTVEAAQKVAVQGEKARFVVKGEYLFGGPVSGGRVSYSILQRPYYRFGYVSSYGFYQNEGYEDTYEGKIIERGEGRLNAQGELVVEVPLKPGEEDYRLTLEAGVTDEAGREIGGTGFITAYRSGIVLDIQTDQYAYQTNDTLTATVRAEDLEGNPVSVPFTVTASRAYWVRGQGEQRERTLRVQGRTDARGQATVRLKLPKQGSYALTVEARDGAGRATQALDWVWVSDGSYWFWDYKSLKITVDKPEYRVGETARFVVQSPVSDGWALVNLEGERIAKPEIVRFQGSTFTYELKLTPQMAPNGYLSVTILGQGEYYSEVAGFLLPPSEKFLNVAITSDKTTYKPGETATYRLKVADPQGRPVKSQVTVGLVDEAIYLVRPEKSPDIRGFFWGLKSNVVGTQTAGGYYFGNVAPAYSTAARAPMDKAVFGQSKEALAQPRVREDFRDTILWLPSVETNEQGEATVEARFPDNLTQWRLTARAISLSDTVGQATQTVTTTLPVIARLSTPRFLVRGDEATLRVIGQNNLAENQAGQLRLEATNISLLTPPTTLAQLPAGGRAAAGYRVRADQSGTVTLQASALTPAASDALRTRLSIFPKGLKEELGWASQSGERWKFTLPPSTDLSQTQGKLYLTPSLAAAVTPALGYLAGYPYGCSEQTMSRFLPSVLAKQAGDFAQLPENLAANLDDFVAAGLKRLYDFQHEDGGWGFWQNDASSVYISSYVLSGLLQAQQAGYRVREDALRRGVQYLLKTLNRPDASTYAADAVAYAAYAFALAGPRYMPQGWRPGVLQAGRPLLNRTAFQSVQPLDLGYLQDYLTRRDLTPYGHALIVLAYQQNGNRTQAERALDGLLTKLTERERSAYWEVRAPRFAWNDDRLEATARGLEALAKLRPNHPAIAKIVNWLMQERKGARWISTKDTAAVVVAALALAKASGEQPGEQEVQVSVNGQTQTLRVPAKGAELALEGLRVGANEVEVISNNRLYLSGSVGYFEERAYLQPEAKGLRVARTYEKLTPRYDTKAERFVYDRSPLSGPLKVGELVVVTLTVRPEQGAVRYVVVEEPTPAGLAVVENDDSFRIAGVRSRFGDDYYGWNYWFDGREIRDRQVEFFFSYLSGPVTFTYVLRAETPGSFTALPTLAWMMYEPEVRGVGTVRQVQVRE
ncbi:alpha-2-macroglobulin family protein [Meiothermus hypogaeus]|uniref:Alpha-2-macroglobulin n=2 Tax=Meiothermus hypogaeus TaxID=884155 RepID=A0A511QXF9_9DEIN|nr:MG2 domain-containing protein [Meiothermus hypogaeus]RIH80673.1 putative lipoprotein YfhM [Meiothermus hypogaeus]GEM82070.1 hypothetical protein MHY01S_02360 [Meiothermus hypogaeus NBRC 106114]